MEFGLVGRAVEKVDLDGFSILIRFGREALIRIETSCEFSSAGIARAATNPERAAAAPGPWQALVGQTVRAVLVDETTGSLELTFADDSLIVVEPDADYEAWTFAGSGGRLAVAEPGGGLTTWG